MGIFGQEEMKHLETVRKTRTTVRDGCDLASLMSIDHHLVEDEEESVDGLERSRDSPAPPLIVTLPVALPSNGDVIPNRPITQSAVCPESAQNASSTDQMKAACDSLRNVCKAETPTDANLDGVFLDVKCQTVCTGPPPRKARVKD